MEQLKLRYIPDSNAGYLRVKSGRGYVFLDPEGSKVMDAKLLDRFHKLVIPPAWQEVWISPFENGHLQVTGYDLKGRKQYIYHPEWVRRRQQDKFSHVYEFGKVLPRIRKQIQSDLRRKKLDKEKVTAIALNIMEETLMRVGNEQYRKQYNSFGLTTLRNRHVTINGHTVFFRFKGKKGVQQQIRLNDRSLSRRLRKVKDIPGQELFQYYDENGTVMTLDSGDLNAYIQACTGKVFTTKDFRTWLGTLWAFRLLCALPVYAELKECNSNILNVIDGVAERLGNTRSVCKKYYIAASLFNAYEDRKLFPYLKKAGVMVEDPSHFLKKTERQLLTFLKNYAKQKEKTA